MASRDQVLDVLTLLSQAYPEKSRSRETLELYVQNLLDIPHRLLEKAALQHIRVSNWFPRIAELRGTAVELAGTTVFPYSQSEKGNSLAARALALERIFYETGQVEKEPWQMLVRQFELVGRTYRAEYTRQRLERFLSS
ncbi:MAG: hypothetical protein ACK2U3_05505 [Anaerolineales bacterium]|jgi:hypothetical protein